MSDAVSVNAIVVIPVADEARTIARVIKAARAHAPVVVVDDGSRDGSADVALAAGAEVLRHPRRLGKAQALLTGVAAARRRGVASMITLDGDGQHDAASIPVLLAAAGRVRRTIVVGSRLDGPGALPSARRNAVRLASFFASWTCGLPIRDTQSGFRIYPVALFDEVRTRRGGFVFETEILLAAAARGWTVQEVPVAALPRGAERSRFRPLRDGAAIGAFLARRVGARWALESRMVAADVLGVFGSQRMSSRHVAMLQAAAVYSDSPVRWSAAFVTAAARRATARLGATWQASRGRGTVAAARGTLAAPITLPLLLLQALMGTRAPDLLTPLVNAVYGDGRAAAGAGDANVRLSVGPEPLTEGP
jgi:glycosyl transferase family 2